MTLVTSVGGASGPLYGTFFLRAATAAGDATDLDAPALLAALRAGLEGIVARGKAEAGDKTMYDALAPAIDAFDEALASACRAPTSPRRAAADAAAAGRDATEPMLALKGRASLPRRAQRRPPRPRRRIVRAAARGAGRHARRRWRSEMIGIVVVSHSLALARGRGRAGRRDGARRRCRWIAVAAGAARRLRDRRGARYGGRWRRSPRPTAYWCSWTSARPCSAPSWRWSSGRRPSYAVRLTAAPMVEGLVAAVVRAAGGADLERSPARPRRRCCRRSSAWPSTRPCPPSSRSRRTRPPGSMSGQPARPARPPGRADRHRGRRTVRRGRRGVRRSPGRRVELAGADDAGCWPRYGDHRVGGGGRRGAGRGRRPGDGRGGVRGARGS